MGASYREQVARTRSPSAAAAPRCSCDLLLSLTTTSAVGELLALYRVTAHELTCGRDAVHEVLASEPADWRLRLSARGPKGDELEELLAIVRSAESHAYQLLEHVGVPCTKLRKQIIDSMRARAEASAPPRPSRDRARLAAPVRPRRSSSQETPRPVRAVRAVANEAPAVGPASEAKLKIEVEPRNAPRRNERLVEPSRGSTLQPVDPATLPPICGRDRELGQLADALGRRTFRAPLLVGPPGSGRTLLALHLAKLLDRPIFRLDATTYDDEQGLRDDLERVGECKGIAVLDDVDRAPSDAAPPFLAALAHAWSSGTPPILTIVGPEGHGRLGTWLPGAMEAVDVLALPPLRGSDLEAAVRLGAPRVLEQHGLQLAQDAKLGELTRLADRYLTGLAMPARALDLLDLACARTARRGAREVDRSTWLDIVAERSGLPQARIEVRGDQDVLDLEARLAERIVGHEHVTETIARLIRRNRAGFGGHRPVLTALLLGPSGVGKTEIAKALCAALFDREDALLRLDMSEYAESHAVARIVGAPPGYVGHEHGGALTEPMLARPHCVVLLDEIEKAHRDVHQLLLQVFDEGRLTDGRGRTVDFRHAVVVMTSNLGAAVSVKEGLHDRHARVLEMARAAFPIELWNRIEAPLVLAPLDTAQMVRICQRLARASSDRLVRERGIRYALSQAAAERIVALAGRDPELGARPLRHLLTKDVESAIADAILRGQLRAGMQVEVDVSDGDLILRIPRSPRAAR